MKLIKCWHVKLYRNLSTIPLSRPMETLIFEGYSKDKPVLKPHDEGLIELFTAPDQLETKTIRTCGFSSMVCTPVYEAVEAALNPPRAEMLEYVKAAIGEGYQPENEEAITDLSLIDALNDNDLNREFGKCWQWYDMGGGMHETFEKQVHFEEHKEAVIKAIGSKAIGGCSEQSKPESNKHALKSDFFTIEIQVPTAKDLNKIFFEVCRDVSHLTPSHSVFTAVFEEVMKRVNASISASMTTDPKLSHHPYALRGKQITPIEAPADDKAAADFHEAKSRYDYNSFKSASKPLVKWLNENANPHATVIVEVDGATLYSANSHAPAREFLKD